MRRRVRVVTVALSMVVTGGLSVGTAVADSGPVTSAGCAGVSCWAQLGVHLSGPGYQPGGSGPNTGYSLASVPPPPCWYTPFASAPGMEAFLKTELSSPGAVADGMPQMLAVIEPAINAEAKANHGAGAAGEWYTLTEPTPPAQDSLSCIQQNAGATDQRYYIWVPAGTPAPQPAVPAVDLAEYAFSQMTLPGPKVALNPQNTTYVTLPTFVKAANVQPVTITATLGAQEQVTVTATPTGLAISAPGATPYGNGRQGNCLPQGSQATTAVMDAAGAGKTPDCGFVFRQPSTGKVPISAAETWTATWNGGQALPQQPIPTAGNPPVAVQVNEIQSVGGAG